jgi:hypothetical protein
VLIANQLFIGTNLSYAIIDVCNNTAFVLSTFMLTFLSVNRLAAHRSGGVHQLQMPHGAVAYGVHIGHATGGVHAHRRHVHSVDRCEHVQ